MADTKISGLTALTGANTASGDLLTIVDISDTTMAATGTNKKITLTALQSAPVSAGTANGVAYLNGSKVVTTGSALTFDGTNLGVANGSVTAGNTGVVLNGKYSSGFPTSGAGYFQLQTNNVDGTTGGLSVFTNSAGTLRQSYRIHEDIPSTNSYQSWNVNGSEQMRLTSTGLGIGTSSPSSKLQVNGNLRVEGATSEILMAVGAERTISASGSASSTALTFKRWNGSTYVNDVVMDGSGNLGLGVTPSAWGSSSALQMAGGQSYSRYGITNNAYYDGGNYRYISTAAATLYGNNAGSHLWFTAASGTAGNAITFTQAMTLDSSGNLLVGQTSTTSPGDGNTTAGTAIQSIGKAYFSCNTGRGLTLNRNEDGAVAGFFRSGTQVGSISVTTTATAYNTSSDQRLKENIVDADSASSLIDSLQVRKFDWKADGSHQRYGFVAQELVTVAPEAVHQPTDTEEMMAVDYSKLVPILVKELQSLRARVAQLESN